MVNNTRGNNKIKICFLINCFSMGGAQTFIYNLVKDINKDIFDVSVIGIKSIGPYYLKLKDIGIDTYSLNVKNKYDIFSIIRLYKLIKHIQPDILHTNLFYSHILGRIVSILFNFKLLSTIHNTLQYNYLKKLMLKITDYLNDYNVVVCNATKDILIKKNISKPEKSITIYNGVDVSKFNKLTTLSERNLYKKDLLLKEKDKVLISIGRIEKPKGYNILIDAVKLLKEKEYDFKLLIVGDGILKNDILNKIKRYNLTNDVLLLGNRENVDLLLNISDIFIMSSLWEGLPLVVLEAMACKLPVIATSVGGISEIIKDNVNGFLVRENNAFVLSERISEILKKDSVELDIIGNNARNTIVNNFKFIDKVKEYEIIYEKLIKAGDENKSIGAIPR